MGCNRLFHIIFINKGSPFYGSDIEKGHPFFLCTQRVAFPLSSRSLLLPLIHQWFTLSSLTFSLLTLIPGTSSRKQLPQAARSTAAKNAARTLNHHATTHTTHTTHTTQTHIPHTQTDRHRPTDPHTQTETQTPVNTNQCTNKSI